VERIYTLKTTIFFSGWREIGRTTKADGGEAPTRLRCYSLQTVFARATATAVGGLLNDGRAGGR